MNAQPTHLDLQKDAGLSVSWADGSTDFFPLTFLRRMSPSAEQKHLRESLAKNPLTVLPAQKGTGPLKAVDAELIGNYAIRIRFSDGHHTGLYSWEYLRRLAAQRRAEAGA